MRNSAGRFASERDGTLLNDRIKQFGYFAPKQELYEQLGHLLDGPLASFATYWELLTDEELRQVARHPQITLGSHGWLHNEMGLLPLNNTIAELQRSSAYLREVGGSMINCLAWPSGSYSYDAVRVAADMGFQHQFAVDLLPGSPSPMLWPRYGVYDFPVSDRWLLHLIARGAQR
jgi:peptidoglycan/xylan/chitin deacetylase (PgdA/CDA1 family)